MAERDSGHGLTSNSERAGQWLRRAVAEALAKAADGDACFDGEHEDPEMWEANAEDRDYWLRLADAAVRALPREIQSRRREVTCRRPAGCRFGQGQGDWSCGNDDCEAEGVERPQPSASARSDERPL